MNRCANVQCRKFIRFITTWYYSKHNNGKCQQKASTWSLTTPHSLHYVSYGDPLWVFVTKMHSYNWTTLYGILLILKICFSKDDDFIKWKHFLRYWPFVQGIHRSPVNSPHKGQWHGTLLFSLIRAWINVWVNNRDAGDLRRHRVLYDVTLMKLLGIHDIPILHGVISWWYITALHDI